MIRACDAAGDVGQWQQYLTPGSLTFFFAAAPTAAAEAPGPSFRLAAPSAGAALVSADASCAGSAFAAYFFLASMEAQSSCEAGSTGAPRAPRSAFSAKICSFRCWIVVFCRLG